MKRIGLLLAIAILAFLFNAGRISGSVFAAEQEPAAAPQPGQSQPPPWPGPMMGGPGMMWGRGPMGPGMMGPGMMGGPMMMDADPKTRGEMMEIQGRAMKEMGALIEKRGKELQQQK
jgi:hypothetical protein